MDILILLIILALLCTAAACGYSEGYDEGWLECEAYHHFEKGEENAD